MSCFEAKKKLGIASINTWKRRIILYFYVKSFTKPLASSMKPLDFRSDPLR